ncbi:hypothetical protein RchiOBHm_Chr5g0079281 [Rosa chinensis]|uniref:Uncharacterized protein n=1 Tax=Rosa chinensis TaxID=74649 RepID=A0A2P6QMG1_ROSCH|nr:uncharacterized protein LOC112202287 [Rosa chinensis]XP_024198993.1 uncharacterized protein LOC112202287 [Rosa chinensis]XP_024198994.1 uncharacterized protein LOC112202287 [Rosa chinensis]XP_040362842.1 uncharacterized protein LOC112202287 [Rosa chinensis]XP_040362843.1 uncharacterized protein LOC112202287 [Rosa chinensis]XP_040362844.1 uncharacterized protein LOC112202287 [Rosa chinensis]XP_040362845.1 uncharacterized protein LOC112202287 [Rosa chinensis]XP_040362846.1 uncharacterized p
MRIRKHWKPPSPPPSSMGSSNNLLPHEEVPEVSSAVVHTCATWSTIFWACQLSDAPDEQSDNRGILRRGKKLRVAEFAQRIMASLSRNQDETPALTQRKVCNFFIKKSCRMERPKCTSNRMTQVEGQARGLHPSGTVFTQGVQNKEKLSSFKFEGEPAQKKSKVCNSSNNKEMPFTSEFDVEDNEERKKRRRKSY